MLLCEFVLNSTRAPPREEALYHTLLQLYLAERLADEPDTEAAAAAQPARRCALSILRGHGGLQDTHKTEKWRTVSEKSVLLTELCGPHSLQ